MQTPQKELGELIKIRRKELKIRQEELADLSNIALRTIRDLEKGVGNPSIQTLSSIMTILGIELVFTLKK
jgi:transcriptional regulator with XRE-family HTH domain